MSRPTILLLACALILLFFPIYASARLVEHTFNVESLVLRRLCKEVTVTAVNGTVPGPTIYARDGDTLVVHVLNNSPYNITIHWHGVLQYLSCWADGTGMITQCPITPGNRFTYKFNISGQEGTTWWHAHSGFQRVTVYGALVIYPRVGRSYPFPKPYKEVPIMLGEWYNQNIVELEEQLLFTGAGPNFSDAFTINGLPGDLYSCYSNRRRFLNREIQYSNMKLPTNFIDLEPDIYKLNVVHGKTYLLRIITASLAPHLFFKIANHKMKVVAVDASYTNPYITDLLVLSPGQTIDVLLIADQPPSQYYMASHLFNTSIKRLHYIPLATTAVLVYDNSNTSLPKMPIFSHMLDTQEAADVAFDFLDSLTGLVTGPFWEPVPREVDEHMFINVGMGLFHCVYHYPARCLGPYHQLQGASLNNMSFALPTKLSILEAFYDKVDGIYTTDFPNEPLVKYDYTNPNNMNNSKLIWIEKSTKVKKFRYNTTIEIVLQSNTVMYTEAHDIHIHGHNFYVLGQGMGNYDPVKARSKLNFVNPHMRHTILMPIGGWVVIRFQANNPGVWSVHCHDEGHLSLGLATAFIVEDGPTPSTMLPPPPQDLPRC